MKRGRFVDVRIRSIPGLLILLWTLLCGSGASLKPKFFKSVVKSSAQALVIPLTLLSNQPSLPFLSQSHNSISHAANIVDTTVVSRGDKSVKYKLFEEVWNLVNENYVDDTYNNQDWQLEKTKYLNNLDAGADEHAIIKKMLASLGDKYSRLMDKQSYENLYKYDAIGIGLLFTSDPGMPLRVAGPPISGSSSEKAGLKQNDFIISIDKETTEGMSAMTVLDNFSNDNKDQVVLEYLRLVSNDAERAAGLVTMEDITTSGKIDYSKCRKFAQAVTLARTKQNTAQNPVSYSTQRLDADKSMAGYIRFSDFNSEALTNLRKALLTLNEQNIDELVLDIRGNTGGAFQFALNIGGMFMDNKPMVTAAGRTGDRSYFRTSYPQGVLYKDKPLVIITDALSASASEVLTGGLRDNCRAVTTGGNTFGKGKIQAVFGLTNGEGLVMTVAQYVTPKGQIIQSKGIAPDLQKGPSGNAYMNLATGSPKPDLNTIDFEMAKKIIKTCSPVMDMP
jgi:carboxyl-terminal processing protease